MNIMGFKLGKKHFILIGVVLLIIIILSTASKSKEQAELESRRQQVMAEQEAEQDDDYQVEYDEGLSESEIEQQAYIDLWGQPPSGFRWNDDGELIPVSSDELTSDDVLWNYLRALSILDFSTVQKYSISSLVLSTYSGYFDDNSLGSTSYYSQFIRKAYKFALTSIEVESIGNSAIFANGTTVTTVKLKVLDLTDKDFWLEDKEELFNKIKDLYLVEMDSTKAQNYVYDYIYDAYEKGKVGKRELTVEIKLDKVSLGGWLVADDTDLNSALKYEDGVNVAQYILEEYSSWFDSNNKF